MEELQNLMKHYDEPDKHLDQIYREITSMKKLIVTATNGLRKYIIHIIHVYILCIHVKIINITIIVL